MKQIKGSQLGPIEQCKALSSFVHRYTRDHMPQWVVRGRAVGKVYSVEFDSDQDWLEHTLFWVRNDGQLSRRHIYCESSPTWPDGQKNN